MSWSSWGSKGSPLIVTCEDSNQTSGHKSNLTQTSSVTGSRSSWGSKGSQWNVAHTDSQQTLAKNSNWTSTSSDTASRFSWESKGSQLNAATNDHQQKSALYNDRSLGLVSCNNRKSIDSVNRIKPQRKVGVDYPCTSRKQHSYE